MSDKVKLLATLETHGKGLSLLRSNACFFGDHGKCPKIFEKICECCCHEHKEKKPPR